jgi:hypothetical protein
MKNLAIASSALALMTPPTFAAAEGHVDFAHSAWTYREMAVFNHVAGGARFVGNFVAEPGRCHVIVFQTRADDRTLHLPLLRRELTIAAGRRSVVEGGPHSALAIACAGTADEIRVAPQLEKAAPSDGER